MTDQPGRVLSPEDCPARPDEPSHCDHWWDCEPCCWCGDDAEPERCDCPKHTKKKADVPRPVLTTRCEEHSTDMQWCDGSPLVGYDPAWRPVGWMCPCDPGHEIAPAHSAERAPVTEDARGASAKPGSEPHTDPRATEMYLSTRPPQP